MAALRTILIELLGGAIDPFDIVTAGRLLGFFVPASGTAFLHFFAGTGELHYQRMTAFGTFLIKSFGFDGEPLDVITAFVLFGFFVPGSTGTALELFSARRLDNITE